MAICLCTAYSLFMLPQCIKCLFAGSLQKSSVDTDLEVCLISRVFGGFLVVFQLLVSIMVREHIEYFL